MAKLALARFFAVLISGTLAVTPFSCCCARVEAQELASHVHPTMAMAGMSHDMPAEHAPDRNHACPHKQTASLDAAKWIAKTVAVFSYPAAAVAITPEDEAPVAIPLRTLQPIRPPPLEAVTLVSEHVLLLT